MENVYEKLVEHPQIVIAVICVFIILIIVYIYRGTAFKKLSGFTGCDDSDLTTEMKSLIAEINKKQNVNLKVT